MKELEKQLNLSIPIVSLVKVKTQVAIPQKTLTKLEDRVENAKNTIMTRDRRKFKTILLIDDALGSGATLNETAAKIKSQHLAEKVIGLAITGSFKGFEIISEV
jgi:predicted amidophosphoribosyltransferase